MSSDRHNALARDFVQTFGRECTDFAELMVVLESILTGCMLLNVKLFGQKPHVASGLVEAAAQRAIERFAKEAK